MDIFIQTQKTEPECKISSEMSAMGNPPLQVKVKKTLRHIYVYSHFNWLILLHVLRITLAFFQRVCLLSLQAVKWHVPALFGQVTCSVYVLHFGIPFQCWTRTKEGKWEREWRNICLRNGPSPVRSVCAVCVRACVCTYTKWCKYTSLRLGL